MFGQKFEPLHLTEVSIAALNEEGGIGATISELSENISLRILVIVGHSVDRLLKSPKIMEQKLSFKMEKRRAMH